MPGRGPGPRNLTYPPRILTFVRFAKQIEYLHLCGLAKLVYALLTTLANAVSQKQACTTQKWHAFACLKELDSFTR